MPETIIHAVRLTYGYNNILKGAVIVTVSGDILKSFLTKYAPKDLGSIYIFNNDGLIISHTDNKYIGKHISEVEYNQELLNQSKNNESGYFKSKVDETSVIVSYQRSLYSDWVYVSVATMDAISSAKNLIFRVILLISLLAIFIGILMSLCAAKKLFKPIKSIANYCLKIPYNTEKTREKNEYSLISKTINNMEIIVEDMKQGFKEVLPMLKMNFLSALFSDNPPDKIEINKRMQMLNIKFPYIFFCAGAIKLDRLQEPEKVVAYEYEKLKISSQLEKIFNTNSSACLFYEKDNIITVLFNFNFDDRHLFQLGDKFITQTFEHAPNSISVSKYLSFGEITTDISKLTASYKKALNGLNYSYIYPQKYIFNSLEITKWEKAGSINNLLLNNLSNSLRSFNQKKCILDLKAFVYDLKEGGYCFQQVYASLRSCVSIVREFISIQDNNNIDLSRDFNNIANILQFEAWLIKIINQEFSTLGNTDSTGSIIVKKAKILIENNFQNSQLSLEYVADELGISRKHLSRVFKNETGITFIDYLINLKLNYSRNLLVNTDLKIEEISSLMGYSTPQYFISRFKIMFGCTPSKYRQEYVS